MSAFKKQFEKAISQRAEKSLLRSVQAFSDVSAASIELNNQRFINFASNDYLGLAHDFDINDLVKNVISNTVDALETKTLRSKLFNISDESDKMLSGAMASPLVIGNSGLHVKLSNALLRYLDAPENHDVLLFSSGFAANQGVLNALFQDKSSNHVLLQDKLNHASLLDAGTKLQSAGHLKQLRFNHNDLDDLTSKLTKYHSVDSHSLVVTEGVFSMDGDAAPLHELKEICSHKGAMLMVDDAHGFGIEGSSLAKSGITLSDVDIYVVTFGKALGSQGAAVIADKSITHYLQNFSKEYIYSTHISPLQCAATLNNLIKISDTARQERLRNKVSYFKQLAREYGLNLLPSDSAIQPVLIGNEQKALSLQKYARSKGFWVSAIRTPTVKKGQSRLRVTINEKHSFKEINGLAACLAKGLKIMRDNDIAMIDCGKAMARIESQAEVASHFGQSASTYTQKAQLQNVSGNELIERLRIELVNGSGLAQNSTTTKKAGLDLGCGPGLFQPQLINFCNHLISLDLSPDMLSQNPAFENKVCADSHALPLQDDSIDWVFSNLMVQWCDFEKVAQEIFRVLKPGGVATISTLLPGSLFEFEQAWQCVDDDDHIHKYQCLKTINSALTQFDFSESKTADVTFWYQNASELAKELKSLGANFVATRKRKGLITKSKWQEMEANYQSLFFNEVKGAIPATYKVQYITIRKE